MNTNEPTQQADLLKEILPKPSNEIKTNRFSEENQAAKCDGTCAPGRCIA